MADRSVDEIVRDFQVDLCEHQTVTSKHHRDKRDCSMCTREMLESYAAQKVAEATKITTRCPSCGGQTLFIGYGGHLTCSFIGCKQPAVERAIAAKVAEAKQECAEIAHGNCQYLTRRCQPEYEDPCGACRIAMDIWRRGMVNVQWIRRSYMED